MCGLKVGEPSLVIHVWVANVLQLAEAERRENGGMWKERGWWERGGWERVKEIAGIAATK